MLNYRHPCRMDNPGVLISFLVLMLTVFCSSSITAANRVNFDLTVFSDTVRVCLMTDFNIYIENDITLTGFSLPFKIWSEDSLSWGLENVGGYGPSGALRVETGSRLYPPEVTLDLTSLLMQEDIDGSGTDYFVISGMAMNNGVPAGPQEHMMTMYFGVFDNVVGSVKTICFDSAFIPPAGPFVFVGDGGTPIEPQLLWPEGGRCYPTAWPRCYPPEWDDGLPTELIVDGCPLNTVTLSATDQEGDPIIFGPREVIGGGGTIIVDDHGNGTCDVAYSPVLDDVGKDITIVVATGGSCVDSPCSPLYALDVSVVGFQPVALEFGVAYANGATNNPITKSDIGAGGGGCEGYTYAIVSGPGEIDPLTGFYSWTPGPTDIGLFAVEVEAGSGGAADTGMFTVDVVDENCCPGDANFSGAVNVGDAVYLINYIFKSGPPPLVMNWADANADCNVDVGDVVVLVNFVFRSGPEPLQGCYY